MKTIKAKLDVVKKSVLIMQDLSCYSKSSLNIALPILECAGVECALLPSTILSSQTDGFENPVIKDETNLCSDIANEWMRLGLTFDCFYSGYLGSPYQADIAFFCVSNLMKEESIKVIDPVLGDDGALYNGFDEHNIASVKKLARVADVITPNWTEARLLSGSDNVEEALEILSCDYKAKVALTGALEGEGERSNWYSDGKTISRVLTYKLCGRYPGSGDLFASLLTAFLMSGLSFKKAVEEASALSCECVSRTSKTSRERRMGVDVTPALKYLVRGRA